MPSPEPSASSFAASGSAACAQLPLVKRQRQSGLFNRRADQQLVDLLHIHSAISQQLTMAGERRTLECFRIECQPVAVARQCLHARYRLLGDGAAAMSAAGTFGLSAATSAGFSAAFSAGLFMPPSSG